MRKKIFISYRREDSGGDARQVHAQLKEEFGENNVFFDIHGIALGEDFREKIRAQLASCKILLAIVGKYWLTMKDENGRQRLANPRDWVRVEIATALAMKVPTIPVLVGGAVMPSEKDLSPLGLGKLTFSTYHELRHRAFKDDLDSLIQKLSKELDVARKTPARSIAEQNVQETTGAENTFVTNLFGAFGSVIGQRLANIGARNPPPVPTLPPTGIAPTPVRSSPQPLDITGPWRSNDGSTLVVMQRGSQISVQTIDPFGRVIMQGQGSVGANVAEIVYNAIFPFPSRGQAHFDISPDGRHMRVRTKNYHTGNASVFDVFR